MARKRETDFESRIYFEARTDNQAKAIDVFRDNDLTFLLGPAGTGKTHLAVYLALMEMHEFNSKNRIRVDKLIITRPIVEAGEYLGALPGEVDEKVHPYMLPVYDCIGKIVKDSAKFIHERCEIAPLAYMRGRTFEHSVAILDEAQNCTVGQLTLFLTRLGLGGKMIVSGDTDQTDISKSGLKPWANALKGVEGIGFVEFTEADIVRHPLVRKILAKRPK